MPDHASYLLRFGHLESIVEGDPHLTASTEAIAALRGLSVERYAELRASSPTA